MSIRIYALLALLAAGTARAQYQVVSSNGDAQTVGPNNSTNQQLSTNPTGFNLSSSLGLASAHALFERPTKGLSLSASAAAHQDLPDDYYSGSGYAAVQFNTSTGYYLRYSKLEESGLGAGVAHSFLRNRVTNAFITADGYLPAGQYLASTSASMSEGSAVAELELTFAQANTLCQYAQVVGNGTFSGSTANAIATSGAGASCGSSATSPAVWYRYSAPRSGTLEISTCGSSYDTVLSVYAATSCPSPVQQIACNDDGVGMGCSIRDSRVSINVVAGGSYYIRVSGYNGASGDYVLHIGPDNDQCYFATVLPGSGTYAFDNTFADTDGASLAECSNFGADPQVNGDLWYRFTPPTNGYVNFFTCDGTTWDTKLALYRGEVCQGDGILLTCDDDSCGAAPARQSSVSGQVFHDVPYYFRVGGYLTARGPGHVTLQYFPACPTDVNNDGVTDFFDYDDFVHCFETESCPEGTTGDFNNDGAADFFDYDDFVVAFLSGAC